jgi:pimeloyl-ACP methyl ester carboxylesterase
MIKRALGRVSNPAILVGHSYGGSVITAAGTDDRVAGLVYIAALAPDADETSQGQLDKFPSHPSSPTLKWQKVEFGYARLAPHTSLAIFQSRIKRSSGQHTTHRMPIFSIRTPPTAWKPKPSWYIVANNDQTVHPNLQRFAAKRMNASTHPIDSSHVPMLSHPTMVVDAIRSAVKAIQAKTAVA